MTVRDDAPGEGRIGLSLPVPSLPTLWAPGQARGQGWEGSEGTFSIDLEVSYIFGFLSQ